MGPFDTSIGALLVGTFLNTFLYGLVSYQYAAYVASGYNDKLWVRFIVFFLFLLDTAHSASVIYMSWEYVVNNFGRPMVLLTSFWPYPFTVAITICTAFLVQIFFTYRIWRLTDNRGILCLILTLAICTFGLGIVTSVKAWHVKLFPELVAFRPLLAVWLSMEVLVDVMIAGVLLYKLWSSKTGFKNSDSVLNRLMRMSIQTGACAGLFAVLSLVFFFSSPHTHLFATFGIPISRVYTNTFMDNLLARQSLRELILDKSNVSESKRTTSINPIQLHVRKEVHTVIEEPDTVHQRADLTSPHHSGRW